MVRMLFHRWSIGVISRLGNVAFLSRGTRNKEIDMPEQSHTPETPHSRQQPSAESPTASLRDRRIKPEGVVPKEAQGYLIAGLSVLILLAVLFSKNHTN